MQAEFEARVVRILARPELQAQLGRARELFAADPSASTADGRATLEGALQELVLAGVSEVVSGDPGRPRLYWTTLAAHDWFGVEMPGSRWGADNPDNVYLRAAVDEHSRYRLHGRLHQPPPVDATLTLGGSGDWFEAGWARTIGFLRLNEIETDPDGRFVVSIDPDPAQGRANHLRSEPGTRDLLIRHTLCDWAHELPPSLEIERVGGDAAGPGPDDAELAARIVDRLEAFVPFVLGFKQQSFYATPANRFQSATPTPGGLANQVTAFGHFALDGGEALLVRVRPEGARYLGFQALDPWMVSVESWGRTGCLNGAQARLDADGTYRFVVCPTDPGVHNWIDTQGLYAGTLLLRWQQLPGRPEPLDGAVSTECLALARLREKLPSGSCDWHAAERARQLAGREAAFARRIPPDAPGRPDVAPV